MRLALVGDGPFHEVLDDLIDKFSLHENVDILGWKDEPELVALYRKSRALVLASSREGLPMCVVEAMSFGLPVFVTSVGETPWLVRDGVEGRLVDYGDTPALVAAIITAFRNPDTMEEMGRAGFKRVQEVIAMWQIEAIVEWWRQIIPVRTLKSRNDGSGAFFMEIRK